MSEVETHGDIKMHEEVIINETGEHAFVVWFSESDCGENSYLLEIKGKNEMPDFYERQDFRKISN